VRVLVSGAGGLIGAALAERLRARGDEVGRLVRGTPSGPDRLRWDPRGGGADPGALAEWDAVVHLAGRNLATLWTPGARRAIRESRVTATRGLARAMARARGASAGPRTLLCASAVGWYGSRGGETLTEDSAPGTGFLADLCRDWEAACDPAREAGVRTVHLRTGIVLARGGGPLSKMLLPFRLGLGGRLGDGRQWMSWIALEDAVEAMVLALQESAIAGPINLTSPEPVTNADFTRALGRVLGRPAPFPVPALALRLLPGGFARETLLASQRAVPARLAARGFAFRFPRVADALRHAAG
jgi:uncharacterized protein (TIGR01777 family)